MDILRVTILLAGIAETVLGFYPLLAGKRSRILVSFSIVSFIIAYWTITNALVTLHPITFWLKNSYAAGLLVPPAVLIWLYFLLEKRISKLLLLCISVPTVILTLLTYSTRLIIDRVYSTDVGGFVGTFGKLYNVYSAFFFLIILSVFYVIIRGYRGSSGLKKDQLRFVMLGLTGFGVSVLGVSFVLPLLGNDKLIPLDSPSSFIFILSISYAIIRHKLLDVRLVITRSLVYGVLLSVVSLVFILITIVSAQFFGGSSTSRNATSVLVAILIVFGLDPLKRLLSRATDRVFFQAKIDYQLLLRELSEVLNFQLNRDDLVRSLRTKLQVGLKVKFSSTLLRKSSEQGSTDRFDALPDLLSQNPNLSLRNDSALVKFLREHKHPSLLESLERKIEDTAEEKRGPLVASKEEFERVGGALAAPIFAQGHLIAVLILGPKLSGDTFNNEDLQLIEVLAPQIGSAIQKANLFEEVRQFSESLKVKVEEATEELQERNVSLETLQNITKDITQTLDFKTVLQDIADSVSTKLGYLGAILVFFDEDGRTVRARAITQTPLTKKALDILPIKFANYTTDINDPKSTSLGHQVLRSGEIRMTENFADVVTPPLPKILAATIQKVVGIKSMVLIPIISEGKTIGVIEIGTRKEIKDIDPQEISTMQSMADELGVVARNISLFDKLKSTNEQLEDANKHLQELDRAKSEFVSIASHQLRTPMTGIMGYLSMMTQGDFGKIAPEHQKILSDLLAESQRMIRLINQFLNVSKIEAGKFTYTKNLVQVEDLITREIQEVQKAATDKGLKLSFIMPKVLSPKVMADADKIQDVILNLIDNAIKYTATGSIKVSIESTPEMVHVMVKDTGIGIKHEDAPELFNKFVRGSGIAQIHPDGSGLGLFIAKSIIDSHGGRIWADSEGEGKGSTFQFTVPVHPPAVPPIEHPAAHIVKPRDSVDSLIHLS